MEKSIPDFKKTISCYLLIVLVGFQAISGVWGGILLVLFPSGSVVQLPLNFLTDTPFTNFLIPGLILFLFIGLFSSYVFFQLLGFRQLEMFNQINIYKDMQQAWTFSIYLGIISILWIDFQLMMIGYEHFIQSIYAFVGVLILILALMPSVKNYYKEKRAAH